MLSVSLLLLAMSAVPCEPQRSTAGECQGNAEEHKTGVGSAFKQLGRDFAGLTERGNLLVLGVGGAASLAVHPWDTEITESFSNSTTLDTVFAAGDVGGSGIVQAGFAVGTYFTGRLSHKESIRSLGSDLVRSQIVAQTLTQALKLATQRTRPDESNDNSFPSGHASATFATATVLTRHYGWKAGVPAYAFAAYVGASRLQANKHYASDVIFGAALGIAAGRSVTFHRNRLTLTLGPMAVPGRGLGVSVSGWF